MSDKLMKRLATKVARFFPVIPGETLKEYAARAQIMTEDQRAMIAAYLVQASEELEAERKAERQAEKSAWIAAARLRFSPGPRQSCAICDKYKSLTEAHHIVPLALQFEAGAVDPIQEFRWLCPTHHAAEHVVIAGLIKTTQPDLEGMPIEERDALNNGPGSVKFVELFYKLPRAHFLSQSFLAAWTYMRENDE